MRQNGVGQGARLVQGQNGEHGFLRNLLVVLAVLFKSLVGRTDQGLLFFRAALAFLQTAHADHGALPVLAQALPDGAVQPLEQHLDGAVGQAQHLENLADHAHGAQVAGFGFFQFRFALGHQKNLFAGGGLRRLYGFDGGFAPHEKRHDRTRKHDHFPQGHDRHFPKGFHAQCVRHNLSPRKASAGRTAWSGPRKPVSA